MKQMKLATKILIAAALMLIIFCLAGSATLYQALSAQASQEMEHLLNNEKLALSALVNTGQGDGFDFEMSPLFLSQYHQHNPNGFFRFMDLQGGTTLKESPDAPAVACAEGLSRKTWTLQGRTYHISAMKFQPELDDDFPQAQKGIVPFICLIVGMDEAPYREMVTKTLDVSIPIMMVILTIVIGSMLILGRRLTSDLSILTKSLATTDFSATHAFPRLPQTNTVEVKAVVEKLEELHTQAADVYRDMWLFLGRAAHQLKTPVTAMQTTLDVLLRKDRSKEELVAGLTDVKSAASLLAMLTQKLIASSRISYQQSPPKEAIELASFFSDLCGLFQSLAEQKHVTLKLECASGLYVTGNLSLLTDLFGNLLENAILYSGQDLPTIVTLQVQTQVADALIEIADQGPGFPKQVLNDLFEPFVRGDEREIPGSGLGLSIAQKSVRLLNGEIHLKEASASGSCIWVRLPLALDSVSGT